MMRLSIWQQFSSNHSARFTVVGVFDTPEAAQKATDELNRLMKAIAQWHTEPQYPERLEGRETGELPPPSDPELEFSQQHGIDWSDYGIDWFWTDEAERSIIHVDTLVFINGPESDVGPGPADQLVEWLGGQALIDGTVDGYEGPFNRVTVDVSCFAPDIATAERVRKDFQDYQHLRQERQQPGDTFKTPWHSYSQMHEVSSVLSGTVKTKDSNVYFEKLWLWRLGYGLPSLLAYLKDNGCIDIQCKLKESTDNDEDED